MQERPCLFCSRASGIINPDNVIFRIGRSRKILENLRNKIPLMSELSQAARALDKRREIGVLRVAREHLISESVSEANLRPEDDLVGHDVDGEEFSDLIESYSPGGLEELRRKKEKEFGRQIEGIDIEKAELDQDGKANLHIARQEYERDSDVPEEVSSVVEGESGLRQKWNKAGNFSEVEEDFEEMVKAFRDFSDQDYGKIVSIWEPNIDKEEINSVVEELKEESISILEDIDIEEVREVWNRVENSVDTDRTLKGMTENPTGMHEFLANYILGGNPVKMPVRIGGSGMEYGNSVMAPLQTVDDRFWAKCFDTTAHEFGHTFGRENLSKENAFLPLGEPPSEAVDEGTARFYQTQVFRSEEFLTEFFSPAVEEWFGDDSSVHPDAESLHRYFTAIDPGNRERISADPITYPLHVAIRYELEKEMIESEEPVDQVISDLDNRWHSKMQEYIGDPLGIDIEEMSDSQTVLQDVHWGKGKFGYFPTYTLGDVVAANWRQEIEDDLEHDFGHYLGNADLEPINQWIVENIWSHGKAVWERSGYTDLDTEAYRDHMNRVANLYQR